MDILLWRASFALLLMETLVGMVANGFIVLINCISWFRGKKLSLTDMILTCLGSSRLMWQAVVMLHVIIFSFFPCIYILNHTFLLLMIMWAFTNKINLWFAACLGVWYLTKIAIFSHPIFLQVKQRFSRLLPWLLLGSVVLSAFMTIIVSTTYLTDLPICHPYKLFLNDSCDSKIKWDRACVHFALLGILPGVIPFVIFLSSTILLIISLWMHIRHLRHNGISTKDLSTSVHSTAIKALASFAILYLSSFVAIILQEVLFWRSDRSALTSLLLHTVSGVYPSGHAVILILINPKLKEAWVRMIHHLKCCVSEAPS